VWTPSTVDRIVGTRCGYKANIGRIDPTWRPVRWCMYVINTFRGQFPPASKSRQRYGAPYIRLGQP